MHPVQIQRITAGFRRLLQEGTAERVAGSVPEGNVVLARGQVQPPSFLVLRPFNVPASDVGQLMTGGVHVPVAGVAYQHRALAGREPPRPAQTNLRNVVGEMDLDQALLSRDKINSTLSEVDA